MSLEGMKQVTHREFYDTVGVQDAVTKQIGEYPWDTEYRLRHRNTLVGLVTENYEKPNQWPTVKKYYLPVKKTS